MSWHKYNPVKGEGVLVMLSYNEYLKIIAFQLTERIVVVGKSTKAVLGRCKNMLGFSYLAIPTRHEVSIKPHLHDYI